MSNEVTKEFLNWFKSRYNVDFEDLITDTSREQELREIQYAFFAGYLAASKAALKLLKFIEMKSNESV